MIKRHYIRVSNFCGDNVFFSRKVNQIHEMKTFCLTCPIHNVITSYLSRFIPHISSSVQFAPLVRESSRSFNNVPLSYTATYRSNEITAISCRCTDDLCSLLRYEYETNVPGSTGMETRGAKNCESTINGCLTVSSERRNDISVSPPRLVIFLDFPRIHGPEKTDSSA